MSMRYASRRRAFTLLEALIASVIVAMVALAASTSVAVGIAVEEDNRLAVLAMHAAEQQMGTILEREYDDMASLAGEEGVGAMLLPPRAGTSVRESMGPAFDRLSRITAIATENRYFAQYNGHTVEGRRIEVTVLGPDGRELARLVRFRGKDPES
jgi:prepilin-type N-terminal cleavage/methylation domain-containing protein